MNHILLHFIKVFLFCIVLFSFMGCIQEPEKDDSLVTAEVLRYIKVFASDNGYPDKWGYGGYYTIEYRDWPYEHIETGFYVNLPRFDDTIARTLVLNDGLTKVGQKLQLFRNNGGTPYIGEIVVKTDSVIIIPELDLSYCNLDSLPNDIGKVRTAKLIIEENPNIKTLPLGIMDMLKDPQPFKSTNIVRGQKSNPHLHYDSLPDTLRNWFYNVYEKQDFSD